MCEKIKHEKYLMCEFPGEIYKTKDPISLFFPCSFINVHVFLLLFSYEESIRFLNPSNRSQALRILKSKIHLYVFFAVITFQTTSRSKKTQMHDLQFTDKNMLDLKKMLKGRSFKFHSFHTHLIHEKLNVPKRQTAKNKLKNSN
ncbi:hypothetical protein RFI_06119 [Reticulomyxa filosa]|uniref:Uncharacterized protein n=1 Tax=Reticulomyxa filosa TaxID=46433 RepID=X6NYT8_RETFI|nr:hypothetical protein RFI_06119 [Reticulomyxa filosa]|eukprot:ETO31004.1 hypothetical protein RFI_06119 [Reticulomyxa filosa]